MKELLQQALDGDRRLQGALAAAFVLLLGAAAGLGQWLGGGGGEGERARQLQARTVELETENRALAEELAQLETNEKVNREAYRQVEQQLDELQGTIIEQQEDLAFYRGLVAGPGRGPLRIRRALVMPGPAPSTYRVRLVLSQGQEAQREVRGEVHIRVEGTRGAKPASLEFAQLGLSGKAPARLQFAFRYFQDLEADFALPADFTPARLVVRVTPSTRGAAPTVESYPWAVTAG